MNIGQDFFPYGKVDIFDLKEKVVAIGGDYWEAHLETRKKLAGNRPGNAVFLINDSPASAPKRKLLEEAKNSFLNVVHYKKDPLYETVTKIIKTQVKPFFMDAEPLRVQLASLPPGGVISTHRDIGILTKIHRLHIPIITKEGVNFFVRKNKYYLEPEHLYDLNNVFMHSVTNNSDINRIHLLIDMLPEKVGKISTHLDEKSHLEAIKKLIT